MTLAADGTADDIDQRPAAEASATPDALVLTAHAGLAGVEATWRAFEATAERTVFQSYDWLATWQREIGRLLGTVPAIVVGRDAAGSVAFILPMAIETHGLGRRLTFLGSALCDYNAPLLSPAFAAGLTAERFRSVWSTVTQRLRADPRFRYDLVDLQKMPETIAGRPNPFRALALRANPSRAYVATLGSEWEAFYAQKRSAATRKTERKQAKRLAENGAVTLVEPQSSADRVAVIDTLIDQKRQAFARMGADDIFSRPGTAQFYRAVAASDALRGLVRVDRLDIGSEIGAASVMLIDRGTCSLILSSYHGGALAQHGPGRAHLHALMRRAIDGGFRNFDFTIGDEPYKRDWCDREVTLYDYVAPAGVRGVPIATAISSARSIKRLVKQTPALWRAFTRLRALGR